MANIPVQFTNSGITTDAFERSSRVRSLVHFDPITQPNQLVPFHSSENGDTSSSTNKIGAFCFANSLIYGLSLETGVSQKLYAKNDNTTQTWPTTPSNMNVSAAYDGNCFVDFKGSLWISQASQLDAYTYGSATRSANIDGSGYAVINQGVIHPATGYLYLPTATRIIYSTDGVIDGTCFATAWTLPDTNYAITGISVYGNYLAIECYNSALQRSVVLLWNLDTSVTTVSESIDWGSEQLKLTATVEGTLIGISQYSGASSAFKDRLVVRRYSGGAPVGDVFAEFIFDGTTLTVGKQKQRINHRLYFPLSATYNGNTFQGIASIGVSNGQFVFTFDKLANNDTGLTSGTLNGFLITSDYTYISYVSSATYGMSKTDDQATYTATSYVETLINPGLNNSEFGADKVLVKFGVNFAPLSSGQQVVAKYRVDGGSWKTIFTKTFTTPISSTASYASNRDATGQFDKGVYYEFRLESTGGAVITGYNWQYTLVAQQQ
jgi:hypothetical protein